MNKRLKELVKWVEYCFEMKPVSSFMPVKYKYLYYDDFDESDLIFNEIDDTKFV